MSKFLIIASAFVAFVFAAAGAIAPANAQSVSENNVVRTERCASAHMTRRMEIYLGNPQMTTEARMEEGFNMLTPVMGASASLLGYLELAGCLHDEAAIKLQGPLMKEMLAHPDKSPPVGAVEELEEATRISNVAEKITEFVRKKRIALMGE